MPSAMRTLSLIHLVNGRSANVGNGALTEGAESVIGEDLGHPIEWTRDAWDDYTFGVRPFDQGFVDRINQTDGMIIGGAVAINGREFYGDAGMRFNLARNLWPGIRKPLIFYGLSYRHWPGQTYYHEDNFRWTIDHILSRPDMLLGLRNDGTRQWLEKKFGIVSDRFFDVPDAGVFALADETGDFRELQPDRPNVMLAFNDEDSDQRYGKGPKRETMLKAMVPAIERLITKWHANVILVPHYFDDCRMLADFVDLCRPVLAHQNMIATGLARIEGSGQFYSRYRKVDLVISMRVHSMSPSVGLGVPMVPLVTQDRMTDFLDGIGLGDLAVDAFGADLTDRLSAAIDDGLTNGAVLRRRFGQARRAMREQAHSFNVHVAKMLAA